MAGVYATGDGVSNGTSPLRSHRYGLATTVTNKRHYIDGNVYYFCNCGNSEIISY